MISKKNSFLFLTPVLALGLSVGSISADEHQETDKGKTSGTHAVGQASRGKVSSATIMKAQEKLKDKGYYQGQVDGIMGPQTRAALRRYQQEEGLTVDGRFTRQTAEHMDIVAKTDTADSPGEHFEDAGSAVKEHYGKGGKSMGRGAKEMAGEIKEGEVTEGAKDFGKGAKDFGKQVGKGTGKAAKKVGKGVKDVFDGDDDDKNKSKTER